MNTPLPGRLVATLSAVTLGGFVLASCVTDDEYARQLCLDKGVAASSSAYSDCVVAQKASNEEWRRRTAFSRPNG